VRSARIGGSGDELDHKDREDGVVDRDNGTARFRETGATAGIEK